MDNEVSKLLLIKKEDISEIIKKGGKRKMKKNRN